MRTLPNSADLPDVLAFMQGLWAVVHRMERLSKQMGASVGVTGPQRLVLRMIALFPGLSAGDLAAVLHLHPSTLTGVLRRLEAQALVARTSDPEDRRRTVLRLTRRGARASASTKGTVEGAVAVAFARTGQNHRAATRRFLDQLATCLDREIARTR
ncbi:Organic hydroperoxide resistance transcriptional regulator [Luteitalea pratensis]|uniref:Organic hydroperoxide resistance transcriptional regulator n=1 Tax=Luteitalea pratensis TaxID=1855912 RepID=A0A143PIG3_LUTPR|nr:MarR family transcriptional regulator [Luteitalea pratensis]AMY08335.1 Organic hydroperoxide resistance transcriptional regulator [Luteitalea pratensis]